MMAERKQFFEGRFSLDSKSEDGVSLTHYLFELESFQRTNEHLKKMLLLGAEDFFSYV